MTKYKRYEGSFLSVGGVVNRVELWQESETEFEIGELEFPADTPLTIEWGEQGKEEVLLGSSATLKIISPGDRSYLDLYTVGYGKIRMDVYRDNQIYWRGCIDPEFYEEPYERLDNYDVTLTFSDFGVLDRLPFDMPVGFVSIVDILTTAFSKTQCVESDSLHLSTAYVGTTDILDNDILTNAYLRTDNFYKEDGSAESWATVVKGILQPLAVRVTQYRGRTLYYDFHSLINLADPPESLLPMLPYHRQIVWSSDMQNLSIDKTYNNIKIKFSPYAQASNLLPSECWPDDIETNRNEKNINNLHGRAVNGASIFTYPLKNESPSFTTPGFTLWLAYQAKNVILAGGREVFKIVPQYDGSDAQGVAAYWNAFQKYTDPGQYPSPNNPYLYPIDRLEYGWNPIDRWEYIPDMELFTTSHVLLPPQSDDAPLQMRLSMEVLVDCRINPFEDPFGYRTGGDSNCKAGMERLNARAQILYVPVKIHFKPFTTDTEYVYDNSRVIEHGANVTSYNQTMNGDWVTDDGGAFCWLAYYIPDAGERQKGTALCKWVKNRQAIDVHGDRLDTMLMNIEDGQYIPYPNLSVNRGGELWITVMGRGWRVARYDATMGSADHNKFTDLVMNNITFAFCKMPELVLLNKDIFDQELSDNDVEYNAEVNLEAQEELKIDTICGTYTAGVPAARGTYYTRLGTQIKKMRRAGREAAAEELLCGTLYSQYAERHICLTGECEIGAVRCISFTEQNQQGKKFICVSECQKLREDVMDAKFIEYTQDEYDRQ